MHSNNYLQDTPDINTIIKHEHIEDIHLEPLNLVIPDIESYPMNSPMHNYPNTTALSFLTAIHCLGNIEFSTNKIAILNYVNEDLKTKYHGATFYDNALAEDINNKTSRLTVTIAQQSLSQNLPLRFCTALTNILGVGILIHPITKEWISQYEQELRNALKHLNLEPSYTLQDIQTALNKHTQKVTKSTQCESQEFSIRNMVDNSMSALLTNLCFNKQTDTLQCRICNMIPDLDIPLALHAITHAEFLDHACHGPFRAPLQFNIACVICTQVLPDWHTLKLHVHVMHDEITTGNKMFCYTCTNVQPEAHFKTKCYQEMTCNISGCNQILASILEYLKHVTKSHSYLYEKGNIKHFQYIKMAIAKTIIREEGPYPSTLEPTSPLTSQTGHNDGLTSEERLHTNQGILGRTRKYIASRLKSYNPYNIVLNITNDNTQRYDEQDQATNHGDKPCSALEYLYIWSKFFNIMLGQPDFQKALNKDFFKVYKPELTLGFYLFTATGTSNIDGNHENKQKIKRTDQIRTIQPVLPTLQEEREVFQQQTSSKTNKKTSNNHNDYMSDSLQMVVHMFPSYGGATDNRIINWQMSPPKSFINLLGYRYLRPFKFMSDLNQTFRYQDGLTCLMQSNLRMTKNSFIVYETDLRIFLANLTYKEFLDNQQRIINAELVAISKIIQAGINIIPIGAASCQGQNPTHWLQILAEFNRLLASQAHSMGIVILENKSIMSAYNTNPQGEWILEIPKHFNRLQTTQGEENTLKLNKNIHWK